MSDISMPPEPPKEKPHLFDRLVPKFFLTVMCLFSPLPLLLALINLWVGTQPVTDNEPVDPFEVFTQIVNGGVGAPTWLAPVAFLPALVLLVVLYRKLRGALLLFLILLALCGVGEAIAFTQLNEMQ